MSTTPATLDKTAANGQIATAPKTPVVIVANAIRGYLEKGQLYLPPDYAVENALKSAWLNLQSVQDKDFKPALSTCTQESVVNALLSMCIQGLNVDKKQGYFIVYGKSLTFQRSYFGDEALAARVRPGVVLYYDVIYEGEDFKTAKRVGPNGLMTVVDDHVQSFPRKSAVILGAYCGGFDTASGQDLGCTVMDMAQIKTSWRKSKTYKEGGNTFHNEQPDQACLRTVIRRYCKPIINSSSDALLLSAIREQEMDAIDAEVSQDAEENANGAMLPMPATDFPEAPAADGETGEVVEAAATASPEPQGKPGEEAPF